MISKAIDTYLETLAGFIFEDDKLVTYTFLSKELGLHVNLAKQILWQFWKEHEKRKEVVATFTLIGYLVDDIYRVEVVKESDLSSAKKRFNKITAEHLYSLQRALPDLELLASSGSGDHRQAAIVCKEIVPRKEGELSFLRWGSKSTDEQKAIKSTEKSTKFNLKPADSTELKSKQEKNKPQNIFGNKPTKSMIFNTPRDAALPRGRKRQGSENRDAIASKRQKRKSGGDSRSSNESSENEDEEEPEMNRAPEGEEDRVKNQAEPSPPRYKIEQGKRKVRKMIDKTSVDENGYVLTKKEYVYESCSDSEELLDAPKIIQPPKSQAGLKANRKQASLLNFFKKS